MTPKAFLKLLPPLNTDKTIYLCMTCSGVCMLTDSGPVVRGEYKWHPQIDNWDFLILDDVLVTKNVWVSNINKTKNSEHPWWKDWRFTWINQQWIMEPA